MVADHGSAMKICLTFIPKWYYILVIISFHGLKSKLKNVSCNKIAKRATGQVHENLPNVEKNWNKVAPEYIQLVGTRQLSFNKFLRKCHIDLRFSQIFVEANESLLKNK